MAEGRLPKYRAGDIVTIKQLSKNDCCSGNYRFGLNSEMVALGGKSYTIRSVELSTADAGKIPDDGYRYKLAGEMWSWASSMFEDPDESLSCIDEISDGSIDAFIRKKKCPELDFNL